MYFNLFKSTILYLEKKFMDMRKLFFLLFISVTSLTLAQQQYTIRKLPNGVIKIVNSSNPLDSWTGTLKSDGSIQYTYDNDPLKSFTSRLKTDGSIQTVSDSDIFNSFTTSLNSDGSLTMRDDFNPLNSFTARKTSAGNTVITDDFNPLNRTTINRNSDGSVSVTAPSSSLPNVTSSGNTSNKDDRWGYKKMNDEALGNIEKIYSDAANGAYANPKPVKVAQMDKETAENIGKGAAAAALLAIKFGTGIGLNVGLESGGTTFGLDLYFKGFLIGYQYAQFIDGQYTDYLPNGTPYITEDNNVYIQALNLGFSFLKNEPNLMFKTSLGSWYDDEGLLDYTPNEFYYKAGIQNSFGKKPRSGLTLEAFYSSFGPGATIGFIIPFNRGGNNNYK